MVQQRIAESSASISNTLQLIERIERGPANPRSVGVTPSVAAAPMGSAPVATAPAMPAGSSTSASTVVSGGSTAVTASGARMATGNVRDLLDSRLRIDWRNGSAEELLRSLAAQMGVPFKIMGEKRATAPVTIVSENETMGAILASVAKQIDRSADIVMNKTHQPIVLELHYK